MTEPGSKPESAQNQGRKQVRSGTTKLQVAQSVGAALIGVQSSKNRERDFNTGKPLHFVIGGLIGTLVFILIIWLLVQYLLATT